MTCAALLVGSWGFAPYFLREHRRLEPWKVALIWIGDATTFCWFVRFFVQHVLHAEPLRAKPWRVFKREKEWLFALVSLLVSAGLDAGVTLWLKDNDEKAFANGVMVPGEVYDLRRSFPNSGDFRYELYCRYRDRNGGEHEERFLVLVKWGRDFPATVPAATALAMNRGDVPFALRVRYDPDWPARSWPADFGPDDGNRLHYFSLIVLAIQGLGLCLFVLFLAIFTKERGEVPWWFDLYKAYPFFIEVIFFALIGPAHRASEFWVWV